MTKTIMVFDNNITMLSDIADSAEKCGFECIWCDRVMSAHETWKRHHASLSGIIFDLNMPTIGLTDQQASQTMMGKLTGWIWYRDVVLNGIYKRPQFTKRSMIYSGFLDDLKRNVTPSELALISSIKLIDKAHPKAWSNIENHIKTWL